MQYVKALVVKNPQNTTMGIPAQAIREWGTKQGHQLQVLWDDANAQLVIRPEDHGGGVSNADKGDVKSSMG